MKLNIGGFLERSHADGPGERAVVWMQGCKRRCQGCFNQELLPFARKNLFTIEALAEKILAIPNIEGVTFSGGEPFLQAKALWRLAKKLRESGLNILCYTGYTFEEIKAANRKDWEKFLSQIDLLIDGPFISEQKCDDSFRGSDNQKLIFLTSRMPEEKVLGVPNIYEIIFETSGKVTHCGFPTKEELKVLKEDLWSVLPVKKESAAIF